MTTPEEPLDCIDDLISRIASSSDRDETLALNGRLGLAWLERYERHGAEDAWRAGMECLRRNVATAPDHAERIRWYFALGLGYAERGRRLGSIVDIHEALNWLSAVYMEAPEISERARAAAVMGELSWGRYWLVRYGSGIDVVRALVEVERLLTRLGRLLTSPADPDELTDVRLIVGFSCLERYELTGDPGDLVRGIDLLASAAIWDLPTSDPRRCEAGSELVDALRQLSILDRDEVALDRAVEAAVRTMDSASPADGTAWFLLHRYAASAAYNRWVRWGRTEDLELAYRCWQPLAHLEMDPASAKEYRAVLRNLGVVTDVEPPSRS